MVSKSGISAQDIDGKVVLYYNSKQIDAVVRGVTNSFGLYVNGKKLEVDGLVLAQTSEDAVLKPIDNKPYFGDVPLISEGVCINITLADYNTLFGGGIVEGYTRYNPSSVYNIVQDVSTAQKVNYSLVDGKLVFNSGASSSITENVVYNSVDNSLDENALNLSSTITDTNPPLVSVKPFRAVVQPNKSIELEYYVDSDNMELLDGNGLGKTFTVIVETESGSVVKKTTYAGEHAINTPVFSTAGETWFSISVVDSNGVGSAVKFYDVLVKAAEADNFHVMTYSDLETYGIVADDDTISIAKANKAALSNFFAAVKNNGYNGVTMLKRTYWIDYHEADIVFPDGFTVDLNGATIAATQCNDINKKFMINFNGNIDTHIVNGYIRGNYDGFDFDATRANTGLNPGALVAEGLSCTHMSNGARYCSFERLDISYSVGYECYLDGDFGESSSVFDPDSSFTDNSAIDIATGNIVTTDGMVVTGLLPISGKKEIMLGRGGWGSYNNLGNRRELFYSFYGSDNSYLGTVKSKLYFLCKVPTGAAKVRITGYGAKSLWVYNSGGVIIFFKDPTVVKNAEILNNYWHNTRTIAIAPFKVKGARFINNTYHNISKETTNSVTPELGDLEDGRAWTDAVLIEGCSCTGSYSHKLIVLRCRGFHFKNNNDISIQNEGIEDGFVEGNTMPLLSIWLKPVHFRPFVIYRKNNIKTVSVSYTPSSTGYYGVYPVKDTVVMTDTTIKNYCAYKKLILRNSINGSEKVI